MGFFEQRRLAGPTWEPGSRVITRFAANQHAGACGRFVAARIAKICPKNRPAAASVDSLRLVRAEIVGGRLAVHGGFRGDSVAGRDAVFAWFGRPVQDAVFPVDLNRLIAAEADAARFLNVMPLLLQRSDHFGAGARLDH